MPQALDQEGKTGSHDAPLLQWSDPVSRDREVELKLVLDEGAVERLKVHPALNGTEGKTARQVSTYYDTPDQALRSAGFSLRVRTSKGRFIQTVKQQGQGAAGLFDRPEWEEAVEGDQPDFDRAARTPLGPHLGKRTRKQLKPLIRSDMERTSWHLTAEGADIEVTLDEGVVVGGKARERIAELELELKSGRAEALIRFAQAIAAQVPLRLGVLTKAERGYRLAAGTAGKATKSEPIQLRRDMSVGDGFSAIAASCLKQFRLNEAIVVASQDPAALHQARVAMRRLRSAFSFFRPVVADEAFGALREEVRWFTDQLGDARNLDVLLKRAPRAKHANPDDVELTRALETARARAYETVLEALASQRLRELMLGLVAWIETGAWRESEAAQVRIDAFGRARLDKRWRKVKRGGSDLRHLDSEPLHRLRIEVKKLRYAVEFMASLEHRDEAIARRTALSAALEDLQEHLGELNDLETARALLASLVPAEAMKSADHWLRPSAPQDDPIDAAEEAYGRLIEAGPFWR